VSRVTDALHDSEAVISIAGVVKQWGSTLALNGATCSIGHGVTGLLGANGAGKTTLLGMILGLTRPDAGSIRVFGLDPSTAGPEIRARLGYSPEHHLLPPDVKAVDFVRHVAEVHGLPRREAVNRASDVLWQVGLGEERGRAMGTMSTGQRQRVKLAQALAHDPKLVLLDEPTDGLDPVQRDAMLELIHRVGHEFGITVLLSSHLLEEVERICDAAVILSGGTVAAAGSLDALRGTGEGVAIEFDATPELVHTTLTALHTTGAQIRAEGRGYVISGDDGLFTTVRDTVAETGAGIRRLGRRTVSLEEVFLGVGAADDPASDPRLAHLPAPPPPPPPTGATS
jgi:ABC-2 type transport system ATP-binding protein